MEATHVKDALRQMQLDYVEMPHLRVTLRQAQRLWRLPLELCEAGLSSLIEKGFLIQVPDGSYVRRGTVRRWQPRASSHSRAGSDLRESQELAAPAAE
jgi:hypothetical protein